MSEELIELPSGWVEVSLENIAYRITKGTTPTSLGFRFTDTGILFVKVESLSSQRINHELCAFIGADADEALSRSRLQENDVLFSIAGTLGRIAVVHRNDIPANTNQAICIIRLVPPISSRYIAQFLSSPLIEKKIQESRRGVGLQNLNLKQVSEFQILLSPLNEQKRIADKLDRLLVRVDACRERCDRIPLILKRFRQSVLDAATTGQLIENDQSVGSSQFDSRWQEALIGDLLVEKPRNGYSPKPVDFETATRSLTLTATTSGQFNPKYFKYINETIPKDSHLWLEPGDILIQRANTLDYVGVSAIYDGLPGTFIYPDLMMKCRANSKVLPKFIHYLLLSSRVRTYFRSKATGTAGNMPKINQQTVISAPVRVPPIEEQREIVHQVESLFAFADRLEARYQTARTQVARLTPALLDKAFRGELVPQDPNDEPASVLLEQIRKELATAKANKTERRQRVTVEFTSPLTQVIMLTRKDIQPSHLSSILKTRGSLTAEDLWTASQLEIDDFYDQLKDEEEQGLLRETKREELDAPRLLEAA